MKRIMRKLMFSMVTLTLFLLLLEVAVHITVGPVSKVNFTPVPPEIRMEPTIPDVRFMLRPNAEAAHRFEIDPRGYFDSGAMLTYWTNSLGFRGPETTQSKPLGTFRILGLGDSVTFGTGVRQKAHLSRGSSGRPEQQV